MFFLYNVDTNIGSYKSHFTTIYFIFITYKFCCNHNSIITSFMGYYRVYNKSNRTGATTTSCGSRTTYHEHLSLPSFFTYLFGVRVLYVVMLHLHVFFSSVLWYPLRFSGKNDVRLGLTYLFCKGFVFYLCYLYFSTHTGVQHDLHIRWCSCGVTVARRVSHFKAGATTPIGEPDY